jgi:hypothetical protein
VSSVLVTGGSGRLVAFMRGACTAVRRILAPTAWKTASKEWVTFDPRSRIRNRHALEPVVEGQSEVASLLHRLLAGGVGGDAADVRAAVRLASLLPRSDDVKITENHQTAGLSPRPLTTVSVFGDAIGWRPPPRVFAGRVM